MTIISLVEKCKKKLDKEWKRVQAHRDTLHSLQLLPNEEVELIRQLITSKTKSYHYVLPTQILAKLVDNTLDCRSLQASFESEGAFDARSIAHEVGVPFDQQNYRVLGGSPEPYVNNPLRYPAITKDYRAAQKNKADWDCLVDVLSRVETISNQKFTEKYFTTVLLIINDRLSEVTVVYPTPSRISLDNCFVLIQNFNKKKSGGDIMETLVTALLKTVGERFKLFDRVVRANINASDAATGLSADIECHRKDRVVLSVEVKNKKLTLTQFNSALDAARARQIKEILLVAEKGILGEHEGKVQSKIAQEFSSGQNIYVLGFTTFANGLLVLLGEEGRVSFIRRIGEELEASGSHIDTKKAWAELLRSV